jgi:hypothetical protein
MGGRASAGAGRGAGRPGWKKLCAVETQVVGIVSSSSPKSPSLGGSSSYRWPRSAAHRFLTKVPMLICIRVSRAVRATASSIVVAPLRSARWMAELMVSKGAPGASKISCRETGP